MLAWSERSSRRELEQRLVLRGEVAASFAEAYVADLVDREREQPATSSPAPPSGRRPSGGRWPPSGTRRRCCWTSTSGWLSATRRRPVVAFAVPYQTPHGRRVFSGAYEIASTPLADYLGDAIPIGSSVLNLVDTPVEGPGRWVPWLVLVAFALAALLIVVQLTQHLGSRTRRRWLERDRYVIA